LHLRSVGLGFVGEFLRFGFDLGLVVAVGEDGADCTEQDAEEEHDEVVHMEIIEQGWQERLEQFERQERLGRQGLQERLGRQGLQERLER